MLHYTLVLLFLCVAKCATLPQLDGRIVGGVEVNVEAFPYQISLQYYGRHMCGGAIANEKYIITAAHCTDGSTARDLSIRYGSSFHNSGGGVIKVKKIHQHPQYNSNKIDYDISILELETLVKYSEKAQPVALPRHNEAINEGSMTVVSGWGYLQEGGSSSPQKLQAVFVPIVGNAKCNAAYGPGSITDRMICAGFVEGGKDACQGDSGGPLVYNGKLVGVVSWGYGCARPNYPGVYSNVAHLRPFIDLVFSM